jgi:hypothetical protein
MDDDYGVVASGIPELDVIAAYLRKNGWLGFTGWRIMGGCFHGELIVPHVAVRLLVFHPDGVLEIPGNDFRVHIGDPDCLRKLEVSLADSLESYDG